jgi:hypothetical protein
MIKSTGHFRVLLTWHTYIPVGGHFRVLLTWHTSIPVGGHFRSICMDARNAEIV